jgi:hypothetical protein
MRITCCLVALLIALPAAVQAQVDYEPLPLQRTGGAPFAAPAWDAEERPGMPAWLKWGLVGGAGTAALAALLSTVSIDVDPPSAGEAAVRGFAIGFVTVGGGVAVYQLVCRPGGWSRRNGLCDRRPARTH